MRTHDFAERLGERHPMLKGFDDYLAQEWRFDEETVDFLARHTYFAYPRTLWIKLGVDIKHVKSEQDIRVRHRLDYRTLGRALSKWVAKSAVNKIVFDLTEVTIFAAEQIRDLFVATLTEKGKHNYYVCAPELACQLSKSANIDPTQIFHFERDLLNHLRDIPQERKCVLRLPKKLGLKSFESALRKQATNAELRDRDAILFDLSEVTSISFEAHSMFTPVIHSLAHSHGILAEVSAVRGQLRSRIVQDIAEHGSLRPMRSNLIHTPQKLLRRDDRENTGGILPMHAFAKDESGQIQKMCYQRLEEMLKYHNMWAADVVRVPVRELRGLTAETAEAKSATRKTEQMSEIVWEIWDILHELVDNVTGHAYGLGYIMLELNPEPDKGLTIYVGDTGIGLARGLENSYNIEEVTHSEAATMAMNLAAKLDDRRQLHGSFKHGGRGLEHVKILLAQYSGSIRIRTGNAAATFSLRRRVPLQSTKDLFDLQGTHINVRVPTRWKAI